MLYYLYKCECGQEMSVPEEYLGRAGQCPQCGRETHPTEDCVRPLPEDTYSPSEPLEQAKALLVQDRIDEALELAESVVAEDEANAHAWYLIAKCFYNKKNMVQSRACIDMAINLGHPYAADRLTQLPELMALAQDKEPEKVSSTEEYMHPHIQDDASQGAGEPETVSPSAAEELGQLPGSNVVPAEEPGTPIHEEEYAHPDIQDDASQGAGKAEAVFPWDIDPALEAKVVAYIEAGQYESFSCKCNEALNSLLKNYTFKGLKDSEADLRIFPDAVGVTFRDEGMGCLMAMVMMLPEFLRPVPILIVQLILLILAMPSLIMGIIVLAAIAIGCIILLVVAPYIVIPLGIAAFFAYTFYEQYNRKRLAKIAMRILQEPKSSYSVGKLFRYAVLVPRIWCKWDRIGEVMQILRLETRRKLKNRSFILVVQDNPKDDKGGCLNMGLGIWLSRLLTKHCRIFAIYIEDGPETADKAATKMSEVLGVGITRAKFSMNRLVIE